MTPDRGPLRTQCKTLLRHREARGLHLHPLSPLPIGNLPKRADRRTNLSRPVSRHSRSVVSRPVSHHGRSVPSRPCSSIRTVELSLSCRLRTANTLFRPLLHHFHSKILRERCSIPTPRGPSIVIFLFIVCDSLPSLLWTILYMF
jgi:hypothetical protein